MASAERLPPQARGASPAPRGARPQINLPLPNLHPPGQAKQLDTTATPAKNPKGRSETPVSANRPCPEHAFLTDVADVRQMEQGLLKLLDDFHSGKLQAFGEDCTFERMDQVREQQETLARLHFDLDTQHDVQHGAESTEERKAANKNMHKLMDNLQELCTSIHGLQKDTKASSS